MAIKNVTKSLITQEDIEYGEGGVSQIRGGTSYSLNKVRTITPVNSLVELNDLDTTKFKKAALFINGKVSFYSYLLGSWVQDSTLQTSSVGKVAAFADLATTPALVGQVVYLKEYNAGTGVGGGELLAKAGAITPDNIFTFASGTAGVHFIRTGISTLRPEHGGYIADSGADGAALFTTMEAAAFANGLDIFFGLGVYTGILSSRVSVQGAYRGMTTLKAPTGSNDYCLRINSSADGVEVKNITLDGSVSADPGAWSSLNYDSFIGAIALDVLGGKKVSVLNVSAKNSRRANIRVADAESVVMTNVETNKARGNFGDGVYLSNVSNVTASNITCTDFTRIGFVPENSTGFVAVTNARFTNGHDGSVLYGGAEFNAGLWSEQSTVITLNNVFTDDTVHYGIKCTTGINPLGASLASQFRLSNCVVNNTQVGYEMFDLSGVASRHTLDTCQANFVDRAYTMTDVTNAYTCTTIKNCSSLLNGTAPQTRSISCGAGEVLVEDFDEKWVTLNSTLFNSSSEYYGSIGHFSAPIGSLTVSRFKSYNSSDALIGTRFKFLSSSASSKITINDVYISDVIVSCGEYFANNCVYENLGEIKVRKRLLIENSKVIDSTGVSVSTESNAVESVVFDNVKFDFSNSRYLYFVNVNVIANRKWLHVINSVITKNIETNGFAVRVNPATNPNTTVRHSDICMSNTYIENTGSTTATVGVSLDGGAAVSTVIGNGNWKASTITNWATRAVGTVTNLP